MFGSHKQTRLLRKMLVELRWLHHCVSRPGRMRIRVTQEVDGMLGFVVTLPPTTAADTVSRELTVKVADGDPTIVAPEIGAAESIEFLGMDNDAVHAELVDVDDAGNRSQPSVLDAVLLDTLAPAMPGEMGIRVTREE